MADQYAGQLQQTKGKVGAVSGRRRLSSMATVVCGYSGANVEVMELPRATLLVALGSPQKTLRTPIGPIG